MQVLHRPSKERSLPSKLRAEAQKTIETARRLLKDASEGLVFEPVEHKYYLGERELTSVSVVIKGYAPFDSEKVAQGCSKNPKHELYGHTAEEILAIWEDKKNAAAAAGTEVHEFGEACCLFWQGKEDEIPEKYRDRILPEGFAASSPKEEAVVQWWNDLDYERHLVVECEGRIVNPVLGYAGTFDLLLYDIVDKVFLLKDYKTNEDLKKWYGSYMKAPFTFLKERVTVPSPAFAVRTALLPEPFSTLITSLLLLDHCKLPAFAYVPDGVFSLIVRVSPTPSVHLEILSLTLSGAGLTVTFAFTVFPL